MAIPQESRIFKISLRPESAKGKPDGKGGKTQGLKTGDIVRRQYFDGKNVVYSLMCVLDHGVDEVDVEEAVVDVNGNYVMLSDNPVGYETQTVKKQQPWFKGLLLDGDAPMPGQVLDFVRITSLYDQSRSGALYLTASDDESPFMDAIDGIGRNCSLSWPENINNTDFADPQRQYVVNSNQCVVEYFPKFESRGRVLHIKKDIGGSASIQQTFTQYVQNPNEVIISFWAKATRERTVSLNLTYLDKSRVDGQVDVKVGSDWKYYVYRIIVDYSGRHRRSINFNLNDIQPDEDIYIADFNAILLSSLANFGDASQTRIGKLTGISDPVFGNLDSYGGYFQKLFASASAHISGTLTAGDENGFAATFYAGKIHKNAFIRSLEPETDVKPLLDIVLSNVYDTVNPTGIGQVFEVTKSISMRAQTHDWLYYSNKRKVGATYTFSFWTYCKCAGQLAVLQNGKIVGTIQVPHAEIMGWHRRKVTFKLLDVENEDIVLSILPSFTLQTGSFVDSVESRVLLFTAPQLEAGGNVTQYQPTDEIVTPLCEDYGAWFNRGGIGGTIQNPLLKLNADGEGAIEARSKGFRIHQNGSGYLANHGIEWDEHGNVLFGPNVRLNWGNLDDDAKHNIENKSIKLIGGDTFAVTGSADAGLLYVPDFVKITVEETGMNQVANGRKWFYISESGLKEITGGLNDTKTTLTIYPTDPYWGINGFSLTIKIIDTYLGKEYTDSITIKKYMMDGYTVEVTSSKGEIFRNGNIDTILTAQVFYRGEPLDEEFVNERFTYLWHKYELPDLENEVEDWWINEEVGDTGRPHNFIQDRSAKTLTIADKIAGSEVYVCEILPKNANSFTYTFPITF